MLFIIYTILNLLLPNIEEKSIKLHPSFISDFELSFEEKNNFLVERERKREIECGKFNVIFEEEKLEFYRPVCYALHIVSSKISDIYTYKITTSISFSSLEGKTLSNTNSISMCPYDYDKNLFVPSSIKSLKNKVNKCRINPYDFKITINTRTKWYFGLDGETSSKSFDLVTNILHEVIHGLIFISNPYFNTDEKTALTKSSNYFLDNTFTPSISDNCNLYWSSECYKYFTSPIYMKFNEMSFKISMIGEKGGKYPNQLLYTPDTPINGGSLVHWNPDQLPPPTCLSIGFSNCNGLLRPQLKKGLAIHRLGGNTLNLIDNSGIKIKDCKMFINQSSCLVNNCDWCTSDGFCTDITLIDYVYKETCTNNEFVLPDVASASSSLPNLFSLYW